MKNIMFILATILCLTSCKKEAQQTDPVVQTDTELEELFGLMQGSFNSETQAKIDSSYYNISLHMVSIWEDRGNFLYVEQALNSMQDKPYRQRIYELKRKDENSIASYIYTIPNDSLWIGKWKTPEAFAKVPTTNIVLRSGCEVVLTKTADGSFSGTTGAKSCESTLRGASFATSEVSIAKGRIVSWDRGFDAEGNHVWGAEKGGYIFEELK